MTWCCVDIPRPANTVGMHIWRRSGERKTALGLSRAVFYYIDLFICFKLLEYVLFNVLSWMAIRFILNVNNKKNVGCHRLTMMMSESPQPSTKSQRFFFFFFYFNDHLWNLSSVLQSKNCSKSHLHLPDRLASIRRLVFVRFCFSCPARFTHAVLVHAPKSTIQLFWKVVVSVARTRKPSTHIHTTMAGDVSQTVRTAN